MLLSGIAPVWQALVWILTYIYRERERIGLFISASLELQKWAGPGFGLAEFAWFLGNCASPGSMPCLATAGALVQCNFSRVINIYIHLSSSVSSIISFWLASKVDVGSRNVSKSFNHNLENHWDLWKFRHQQIYICLNICMEGAVEFWRI